MRYRIYDNVDKKYIPEEHARNNFYLDIDGKVVKYSHVLGCMETGDRYTVEMMYLENKSICPCPIFVGDIVMATLPRSFNDIEPNIIVGKIDYDEVDGRFFIDEKDPNDKNKKYCWGWDVHYINEDMKVEIIGNIHGGKDER